jgi:predicted SnoaL-like aldol condensation-catalyzing enzyme
MATAKKDQIRALLKCIHTAFYDLFRLANGKIAEHWDTTEKIAPRNKWKNDNGKF